MAVEDEATTQPAATATCHGMPKAMPSPAITATVPSICSPPSPSSLLRSRQSVAGSSSMPTRKSIITTPNSATSWISWVSPPTSPSTGPMMMPAIR